MNNYNITIHYNLRTFSIKITNRRQKNMQVNISFDTAVVYLCERLLVHAHEHRAEGSVDQQAAATSLLAAGKA
jgi:hypothetical protein